MSSNRVLSAALLAFAFCMSLIASVAAQGRQPATLAQSSFNGGVGRIPMSQSVAPHEQRPDKRPVLITVRLPADAELKLQGVRTSGTGAVRRFRTPPVEVGKQYTYDLEATWKDGAQTRQVRRSVKIRAGQELEVDLHPETDLSAEEKEILRLLNKERESVGARPLTIHAKLIRAAREHTANMARQNMLSHTLDGKTMIDRVKALGYRSHDIGENVALGARTPAEVVQMWMTSPFHRANILNPRYRDLGIGRCVNDQGECYHTLVFGASPGRN